MSENLKPCPFCGGSVTIGTGVVNSYFIVHVDWNKSKCPIRMTNIIPDADTPEKQSTHGTAAPVAQNNHEKPPPLPYMYMKILFLYKKRLYFTLMVGEEGGRKAEMSQDAYIVLTVVSVLIVVVFFTSVFISFITKTITKSADVIAERNALEDKARGMYHGRKYSIEVIFFDKRESTLQYENVVNHTYRDNMITIFFSKKYAVYIPLCNVKRLIVRPMLQDVNYDDCDEKKLEPKTDVISVHDHRIGDYEIVRSKNDNDGFDDFEGDWK